MHSLPILAPVDALLGLIFELHGFIVIFQISTPRIWAATCTTYNNTTINVYYLVSLTLDIERVIVKHSLVVLLTSGYINHGSM